jgi:hypothetical protein
MAGFENLKGVLKEVWEALKDIITEPVVLLLLLSGVFLLIMLYPLI